MMYIIETSTRDDFGSNLINIPFGEEKPKEVLEESQLDAFYYDKVALNNTHELDAPQ